MAYYSGTWQHRLFTWFWKNRLSYNLYGTERPQRVIAVKGWRTALVADEIPGIGEMNRSNVTFMIKIWRWYV